MFHLQKRKRIKMLKKILYWFLIIFALIQFIPVDRTNVPVDPAADFVKLTGAPAEVTAVLKRSCYDCHSNETVYPQYAYIAPFSWSVKHHVNKGRKHVNFSQWAAYNKEQKQGILEKTVHVLEDRKMPLLVYISYHEEAALTPADRKMVADYFKSLADSKEN